MSEISNQLKKMSKYLISKELVHQHWRVLSDMCSPNIGIMKRAVVACPNSPSCLSLFSCVCPNAPGNEGFSFFFPQVADYHRINIL